MHRVILAVGMVLGVGCGQPTEEDCLDDEVFLEETCTRCGNAGGCAQTGPECRPTCDDEDAVECQDGVSVRMCD